MAEPNILQLQGTETVKAPSKPGIYAWYYRPLAVTAQNVARVADSFGQFVDNPAHASTEIKLRYNMKWEGEALLTVKHGTGRPARELMKNIVEEGGDFFANFIRHAMVPYFARPIYIGIAKDLYERVHKQHAETLARYWQLDSDISRYLSAHPEADVQGVMRALDLKHSFALEARVRCLAPRDLVAFICPTETLPAGDENSPDPSPRRALEQVLQLLADPVCGRQ